MMLTKIIEVQDIGDATVRVRRVAESRMKSVVVLHRTRACFETLVSP